MEKPHFYALIIGTEILNGRRNDSHFPFLREILSERGLHFSGSFIIEDSPQLIAQTISYISSLPGSVLFSFGGIGSTPDDHTRQAAADALRDGTLHLHPQFKAIIEKRLGERAYPHPIKMAMLPEGAGLLPNPVNKMSGFYLDKRFFFMPGFPEMSHPMVEYVLDNFFEKSGTKIFRHTLTALCRENEFIELMEKAPDDVEISSLPKLYSDGWRTTISVASTSEEKAGNVFKQFTDFLEKKGIPYSLGED